MDLSRSTSGKANLKIIPPPSWVISLALYTHHYWQAHQPFHGLCLCIKVGHLIDQVFFIARQYILLDSTKFFCLFCACSLCYSAPHLSCPVIFLSIWLLLTITPRQKFSPTSAAEMNVRLIRAPPSPFAILYRSVPAAVRPVQPPGEADGLAAV